MKNFLRVTITDDDALIASLITAATQAAETFTDRSFCYKGFNQVLDSFPYFVDTTMSQMAYPPAYYSLPRYSTTLWNYSQMIKLFRPPLFKLNRITYLSANDQQYHDLTPVPPLWYPAQVVILGFQCVDNKGNRQQCTSPGTTTANPPTWNLSVGGSTVEQYPDPQGEGAGPVVWQNVGPLSPPNGEPPEWQFGSYLVDTISEPARIFPGPPGGFWPQVLYVPNAVQIHFTAGYSADGANVPAAIKTAIMQLVGNWYENREAAMPGKYSEIPNHVKMLLWTYRVYDMQPTRG